MHVIERTKTKLKAGTAPAPEVQVSKKPAKKSVKELRSKPPKPTSRPRPSQQLTETKSPQASPRAPPRTELLKPPCGELGFSVPEAGAMVGLSKNSSYAAAKRGDIPTVRIGGLLIVPRAIWLKKLGLDAVENNAA
jgi:hypothetical protein